MTQPSPTKTVLITGCSSGIGLDAAKTLQHSSFRIVTAARKPEDVARLKDLGFHAVQLDYSDSASVQSAWQQALDIGEGTIYGLVNNGAYGQPGALEDVSRDVLRAQFEANVLGLHELTNLALPVMRAQGEGRIIQISSVLGLVSMKYRGAYNASKYAIEGLTDTLRLELHGTNIHACLVEPGPIESDFRPNARTQFLANIDRENSAHAQSYKTVLARLEKEGHGSRFTLPADAVTQKILHALTHSKPKAHYYVTFPTYLFATLKRIFPTRWLDRILRMADG